MLSVSAPKTRPDGATGSRSGGAVIGGGAVIPAEAGIQRSLRFDPLRVRPGRIINFVVRPFVIRPSADGLGIITPMKWLAYTVFAAAMLAAADSLMKLAAGRLSNSIAITLYGAAAFSFGAVWLGFQWWRGADLQAKPLGVAAAFSVGIAFSLVTLGMYLAFSAGAPISRASPIVRAGGLTLAALGGLVVLREPLTWRYVLGMILTLAGIYLIVTR